MFFAWVIFGAITLSFLCILIAYVFLSLWAMELESSSGSETATGREDSESSR